MNEKKNRMKRPSSESTSSRNGSCTNITLIKLLKMFCLAFGVVNFPCINYKKKKLRN